MEKEEEKTVTDTQITSLSKRESGRRRRSVKLTKTVFRAIDILYMRRQNSCPFIKKSDVQSIDCKKDIVYDSELPDVCVLDVYSQKSEGAKPAVIIVHGGGFTAGDKKYRKALAQFFAYNGFVAVNINYGLAPDHLYPAPLKHLVNGVNYVYAHRDELGIDGSKILVEGDSAGAYFAAMLAAFSGSNKLCDRLGVRPDFEFCGTILNCGIFDVDTVIQKGLPLGLDDGVMISLTGRRTSELHDYEYIDVFAPVDHATAAYPPSFFIYSDHDTFCKGQTDPMLAKLKASGVYTEAYKAKSRRSNHCFSLTWRSGDAVNANSHMISFAKRLVSGKLDGKIKAARQKP